MKEAFLRANQVKNRERLQVIMIIIALFTRFKCQWEEAMPVHRGMEDRSALRIYSGLSFSI